LREPQVSKDVRRDVTEEPQGLRDTGRDVTEEPHTKLPWLYLVWKIK